MAEPDAADDVTPVAVAPGPGALKVRRAQEPLLVAYQPVTDYASTVVAADGLSTLELSRPGELARVAAEMLRRSRASRSAILALRRRSIDPDLQRLLIATLDGRIDAMRLLIRSEQASDTDAAVSRQLRVRYLDAWQGSVGAARGATNQMQAQRTSVGLAAAPEDSIR